MNKDRLNKILKNMEEEGLSQIIVTSTASVYYITGLWVEPHERMLALYINSNGEVILFGNTMFGIKEVQDFQFIPHFDGDNPVEELARHVKSGKLGIDNTWQSRFLISLMNLRKDINTVIGSGPVDKARMCKDSQEIENMRKASMINDKVMQLAIDSIKEGIKENELSFLINRLHMENGVDTPESQIVCFGANSADPHHAPLNDAIKDGDCIILDIFAPINHYWCDMTRTLFFKSVSDKQQKVYETVLEANRLAKSKIKPGIRMSEIDGLARGVIENAGFGEFFTHRTGHNIGIECHEQPDVGSNSDVVAKEGMVFSVEPGIYLPGEFGVRIEDLVVVTKDGCESLNNFNWDLTVIK